MKRTRILIALLLVLMLTVGMPLSALAAVHDVSTADDVLNVVATDTDAEVTMNMKNDIDMRLGVISGNEGQVYTINGNGNTISNVAIDSGDVTVNADMDGYNYIYGDADVTVNGDVEEISAFEESSVNIAGDVTRVYADEEAAVEITGDVGVVNAYGDSTVDITGDVTGDDYWVAIYATDNAQVSVDGNVSGADGYIAPEDMDNPDAQSVGGDGIEASGEAVVSVTGDVNGGDGALSDAALKDPLAYGDGGDAINAYDEATVTVGGDVNGGDGMGTFGYGGDAIDAYDSAVITVGGNVSGGNVVADPEVDVYTEEHIEEDGYIWEDVCSSNAGDGIEADSTVTITVGGNVTGGSTNADGGNGGDALKIDSYDEDPEYPAELGSIKIGGIISGGKGDADSEFGSDGYDVGFDGAVPISESYVKQLSKLSVEDLIDDEGYPTEDFHVLMNLLYASADPEKLAEAEMEWFENSGYFGEDMSQWTEEDHQAYMEDYAAFLLSYYLTEVDEVNMEALKEMYGADQFAKLSVGGYDEDPSFGAYNGELLAAAYMDENVKALPEATTPATGDTFQPMLVASVAVLALLAMTALVVVRKKHA